MLFGPKPSEKPRVTCRPNDPHVVCSGRSEAMGSGQFFYSHQHKGWVIPGSPPRLWSSRFHYVKEAAEDRHVITYDDCPWCGEPLPQPPFPGDDDGN